MSARTETKAVTYKGKISHQGFVVTCACGEQETLFARTLKDARREAEGMGWFELPRSGWNCPACMAKD